MKNKSYIGISIIVLIFGIWALPKIMNKLAGKDLLKFEKVPGFEFTDQNGQKVNNNTLKGKVYVLEFFFTSCPTICPKMHQSLLNIQNAYYGNPEFGIVSITIDPKHDNPEKLKEYAKDHNVTLKNWFFLTGDKDTIYNLANEGFKIYAGEDEAAPGGFEHSGLFALVDKEGYIRSRTITTDGIENPIKFYDGLDALQTQMLKEDISKLLKEE